MRVTIKAALATTMVALLSAPSWATDPVSAPEIDGAAGISALAVLVSVGMVAYNRLRS